MFDDDICFCGNSKECLKKNTCRRGESKVGIHTYSNFYEQGKECEYYIEKKGSVTYGNGYTSVYC